LIRTSSDILTVTPEDGNGESSGEDKDKDEDDVHKDDNKSSGKILFINKMHYDSSAEDNYDDEISV
jgi:hypothetical protein